MPVVQATFWTIVGGFLFLPVKTAIDFPFIPPLDKESIPVLAALIGCRYIKRVKIKLLPQAGLERWLILLLIITPIFTTLNNQESFNGIPGLTLHDTMSAIINQYLFILPFVLGIQLIRTYEDQLLLFKLLVIAGLIYSVPILFEVRMSPQLHTWIYGFFPHSFIQQMRFDGFRPVVFMGHGLIVSMFVAISLGAATVLWIEKIKIRNLPPLFIVLYFFLLLVLCKTLGAFLLGSLLLVILNLRQISSLKWFSIFAVLIALFYPLLSIFSLFPHESLVHVATEFDVNRGRSLDFRFYNEGLLLDHARDKLFFGWGGWGRFRLDESVTDGNWIIIFGQYGLIGFLSLFGLLAVSIFKGFKLAKITYTPNERRLLFYHALIVVVIIIDQLPNASLAAWMLLLSGALMGRSNFTQSKDKK